MARKFDVGQTRQPRRRPDRECDPTFLIDFDHQVCAGECQCEEAMPIRLHAAVPINSMRDLGPYSQL
jgi:hypothetical protein